MIGNDKITLKLSREQFDLIQYAIINAYMDMQKTAQSEYMRPELREYAEKKEKLYVELEKEIRSQRQKQYEREQKALEKFFKKDPVLKH